MNQWSLEQSRSSPQDKKTQKTKEKGGIKGEKKGKKGTKTREKEENFCGGEAVDKHKASVSKKSHIAWRQAMGRQGRKDRLFLCSAQKKL